MCIRYDPILWARVRYAYMSDYEMNIIYIYPTHNMLLYCADITRAKFTRTKRFLQSGGGGYHAVVVV